MLWRNPKNHSQSQLRFVWMRMQIFKAVYFHSPLRASRSGLPSSLMARGQIWSALDHHLTRIFPFARPAMHPSFVRLSLSSTTARASTIGFIGLGRMGYEMALNVFSKTMVNHDLQRQTNESTLGSSPNVLPRFAVCDVNEDAVNNIVSIMRERFPGVNITIRKTPAEYVHCVFVPSRLNFLSE